MKHPIISFTVLMRDGEPPIFSANMSSPDCQCSGRVWTTDREELEATYQELLAGAEKCRELLAYHVYRDNANPEPIVLGDCAEDARFLAQTPEPF